MWAQFCEVIADAPVRTLGLRGRLADVGIGVADKEGYRTGTLGSGDSGGGDRMAHSVDQSARSLTSPRSVVLSGGKRMIRGKRKNNMKRARLRLEGRKEKVEVRSRAVTSHTWNRVTMASGLLYAFLTHHTRYGQGPPGRYLRLC